MDARVEMQESTEWQVRYITTATMRHDKVRTGRQIDVVTPNPERANSKRRPS
jgi:hypothetical protein